MMDEQIKRLKEWIVSLEGVAEKRKKQIDSLTQENKELKDKLGVMTRKCDFVHGEYDHFVEIATKRRIESEELNTVNKNNWLQHEEDLKNKNEEIKELKDLLSNKQDCINQLIEDTNVIKGKLRKAEEALFYYFSVRTDEVDCHSPQCKNNGVDDSCAFHSLRRMYDALKGDS